MGLKNSPKSKINVKTIKQETTRNVCSEFSFEGAQADVVSTVEVVYHRHGPYGAGVAHIVNWEHNVYTETIRFLYQLSISPPPPARPDHGQRTELQHHQRQSPHYIRIGLAWLNKGHTMSVSMMSFTGVPHCEWEVRNNADSIILSISNSFNVSLNPYLKLIIGSDRTPKKSKWHKFVNLPPKNPDWLHRYHRRCCPRQISVSDFVIPDVEIESDLETYQTCYP